MSFVRVDDSPIWIKSFIQNPDMVVVASSSVMKFVNVADGVKEDSRILINTAKSTSELGLSGLNVHTIDGNKIAMETIQRPTANVVMLGALLGLEEMVSFESLKETVSKRFSEVVAKKNVAGMERAYQSIKETG